MMNSKDILNFQKKLMELNESSRSFKDAELLLSSKLKRINDSISELHNLTFKEISSKLRNNKELLHNEREVKVLLNNILYTRDNKERSSFIKEFLSAINNYIDTKHKMNESHYYRNTEPLDTDFNRKYSELKKEEFTITDIIDIIPDKDLLMICQEVLLLPKGDE